MNKAFRVALACVGGVAYGLLLTRLKPVPQALLTALPFAGLILERLTAARVRPVTFLATSSLAVGCGYLYLLPEALARLTSLAPSAIPGPVMPVLPAVIGVILGIGLFFLTFVFTLKPLAADEKLRRRGLILLALIALAGVAIDRLLAGT